MNVSFELQYMAKYRFKKEFLSETSTEGIIVTVLPPPLLSMLFQLPQH